MCSWLALKPSLLCVLGLCGLVLQRGPGSNIATAIHFATAVDTCSCVHLYTVCTLAEKLLLLKLNTDFHTSYYWPPCPSSSGVVWALSCFYSSDPSHFSIWVPWCFDFSAMFGMLPYCFQFGWSSFACLQNPRLYFRSLIHPLQVFWYTLWVFYIKSKAPSSFLPGSQPFPPYCVACCSSDQLKASVFSLFSSIACLKLSFLGFFCTGVFYM